MYVAANEFENDWRSHEDNPLRYRVSTRGQVEVGGWAVGGKPGTRVFRLPEGLRPAEGDVITKRRFTSSGLNGFLLDPGTTVELARVLPDGSVIAPDPPNLG